MVGARAGQRTSLCLDVARQTGPLHMVAANS